MDIKEKFSEGIPLLDPINHMGIEEESFQKLIRVIKYIQYYMYIYTFFFGTRLIIDCNFRKLKFWKQSL